MAKNQAPRRSRRRGLLDEDKRKIILAVIARGCSRRVAAGFVGCVPRTITRTAARDPEFAAALNHAENAARVTFTSRLHAAATEPRYWRAAAWWLERRNREEFAPQPASMFTGPQISEIFTDLIYYLEDNISDEKVEETLKRLEKLIEDYEVPRLPRSAKRAVTPPPPETNAAEETYWLKAPPLPVGEQDLSVTDPQDVV